MSLKLDLDALFQHVTSGGADISKTAGIHRESDTDDMAKLAEELHAGGEIFGKAAADRILAKLAECVSAGGGGVEPRSAAEQIAEAIAKAKGKVSATPGDDTSIRAEANPTPGAKGVANAATALGQR